MGYAMVYGACVNCGKFFSFHPHKVPSLRVNGVKEPICRTCVQWANPIRKHKGLSPIEVAVDAYEACPEEDL